MYSWGAASLNSCLSVDSFLPFKLTSNSLDYFAQLAWVATNQSDACSQASPAVDSYVLTAGATTFGVNYAELTHNISDANSAVDGWYNQTNVTNYIVTAVESAGTFYINDSCPAGIGTDVARWTISETTLSLLGGTKWEITASSSFPIGSTVIFFYGTGGTGDNQQTGTVTINGAGRIWSWARTSTRVCTIIGGGVNSQITTPAEPRRISYRNQPIRYWNSKLDHGASGLRVYIMPSCCI